MSLSANNKKLDITQWQKLYLEANRNLADYMVSVNGHKKKCNQDLQLPEQIRQKTPHFLHLGIAEEDSDTGMSVWKARQIPIYVLCTIYKNKRYESIFKTGSEWEHSLRFSCFTACAAKQIQGFYLQLALLVYRRDHQIMRPYFIVIPFLSN